MESREREERHIRVQLPLLAAVVVGEVLLSLFSAVNQSERRWERGEMTLY